MPPVTATRSPLKSILLSTGASSVTNSAYDPVDASTLALTVRIRAAQPSTALMWLQVQVNLKSSVEYALLHAMESVLSIQAVSRRSGVASSALQVLRGARADRVASALAADTGATRARCCAGSPSSSSRSGSDCRSRRSARNSRSFPPIARRRARIGRACPARWTKRIDQKIAELQRLRAGLTQCIGCGCLSIDKCEYANPADRAGKRGPGPRYWLK